MRKLFVCLTALTSLASVAVIAGQRLSPEVMNSLREAASKTGVDFEFLVAQASLESGFRGNVHANRGSASGLFQFTGATWMNSSTIPKIER